MKYFSLFTGIGGFDLPLKELNCECAGWSEIDKYAIKTFEANFPELKGKNIGDITKYDFREKRFDIPRETDVDLVVGGSPCQSFSIASSNRNGLGGVSGLFNDYARALRFLKPQWFIWENVKGVLSCKKDWQTIVKVFTQECKYNIAYATLNSADYGIPQQRKRVFAVGQRKDLGIFNFKFPEKQKLKVFLKDILTQGYTERDTSLCITATYCYAGNLKDYFEHNKRQLMFNEPVEKYYTDRDISYTIDANYHKCSESNPRAYFEDNKRQIVFKTDGGIRKLSTLECFRLQGFPDEFHNKAKEAGVSSCQLYKQAGNSVTVSVVRAILKNLLNKVEERQLVLF